MGVPDAAAAADTRVSHAAAAVFGAPATDLQSIAVSGRSRSPSRRSAPIPTTPTERSEYGYSLSNRTRNRAGTGFENSRSAADFEKFTTPERDSSKQRRRHGQQKQASGTVENGESFVQTTAHHLRQVQRKQPRSGELSTGNDDTHSI